MIRHRRYWRFVWVLKPRKRSVYSDNECYLYLSFVSRYGSTFNNKKVRLLSTWPWERNDAPKPKIRDLRLSLQGKLINLFKVSFKDGSDEEVRGIRSLVVLAKVILMI